MNEYWVIKPSGYIGDFISFADRTRTVPCRQLNESPARMNCACGNDLLPHDPAICDSYHRGRVLKLITLLRARPDVKEHMTHYDCNISRLKDSLTFPRSQYCIYNSYLHSGRSSITYCYCIHCGDSIDYTGPLNDRKITVDEFTAFCCTRCWYLIQENGGTLCSKSIRLPGICGFVKRRVLNTFALCILRFVRVKDLRLLIMTRCKCIIETCACKIQAGRSNVITKSMY